MTGLEPLFLIGALAGGAMQAVGAITEANAQSQAATRNAAIQQQNKLIADDTRRQNITTAQVDADDKRRENRRTLAAMRASYGNSGLQLTGSPLDVLYDSSLDLEVDAGRTEDEGRARNREGALQMLGYDIEVGNSLMEAKNARVAGMVGAASAGVNTLTRLQRTA